jgi:hypothetical protein
MAVRKLSTKLGALCATAALMAGVPAVQAHHSFAMYDLNRMVVFTGVVVRVDPQPNHLQIYFAPMNDDRKNVERDAEGKPVQWAVEMAGSAQMARQGVSVNTFPPGTVFSMGLHPLRNGENAGTMEGGLFRCPDDPTTKRGKPPAPGMHCDSVEGHTHIGTEPLATPKEPAAE